MPLTYEQLDVIRKEHHIKFASGQALRRWHSLIGMTRSKRKMAVQRKSNWLSGERNQAIVQLRKTGCALEEVGTQFGITRERVRQICVEYEKLTNDIIGVDSRLGPRVKHITKPCPVCGTDVTKTENYWNNSYNKGHCSRKCGELNYVSKIWTDDRAIMCLKMRAQHSSWQRIADQDGCKHGEDVQMGIDRWARRRGIDISWAHPGIGQYPHTIRVLEGFFDRLKAHLKSSHPRNERHAA